MIDPPEIKDASAQVVAEHMQTYGCAMTRHNADGSVDLILEPWQLPPTPKEPRDV